MKLGVIGSMVWDEIHGRDAAAPPVEEWGGIAYALGAFDAALPPDWEIVPLIKVGSDLSRPASAFLRDLGRVAPGTRFAEVPVPNNRVVLRYATGDRRTERMSGGVPGWTWAELGPMVRDLDALYVNFISGFELELGTAQALRQGFSGFIYADLHSLLFGMPPDGVRVLRPLADPAAWLRCFDVVQMNEDEMAQFAPDPLAAAALALAAGVRLMVVTLGPRGAVYFEESGAPPGQRSGSATGGAGGPIRTERIPAPATEALDPTGCGDVFGAALCSALLARLPAAEAVAQANRLAARNAALRGARGLGPLLRGGLAVPAGRP